MDGSKFNLLSFNSGQSSTTVKARVIYSQEIFNCSAGFGYTRNKDVKFNAAMQNTIEVGNAVKRSFETLTSLFSETSAVLYVLRSKKFETVLNNNSSLNYIRNIRVSFDNSLSTEFILNCIKDNARAFIDALGVDVKLNRNIGSKINNLLVLNGFFDIIKIEEQKLILNVTIPVGGVLVIDTENFIATLDGVNIIDLYDGDWPTLKPENIGITIDTGSGTPNTQMLYRGRHL